MQQENDKNRKREETAETNQNKIDEVGKTNIYPVSEMAGADDDAEVVPPTKLDSGGKQENQ